MSLRNPKRLAYGLVGNFLEFYNFLSFVYFAPMIGAAMFPTHGWLSGVLGTLVTFGVGFLFRPLGALVLGHRARHQGVPGTLLISFSIMCCGSFIICATPSYARIGYAAPFLILVARIIQGFSEGGEVGPATDYLFSMGSPEERGLLVALLSITQSLAELTASAVGLVLALLMPNDMLYAWGWRVPFALGLLLMPVGVALRRTMRGMSATGSARPHQPGIPLRSIDYILIFMAISYATIAAYIRSFNVTYALSILHQPSARTMLFVTLSTLTNIVAIWTGGLILRRCRPTLVLGSAGAVYALMAYPLYRWCATTGTASSLLLLCCLPAFVGGLMQASGYLITLRALPDRVRGQVFGVIYSLAVTLCGATTQPAALWLIHRLHDPTGPAYILMLVVPVGVIALLVLSPMDRTNASPVRAPHDDDSLHAGAHAPETP